MIQLWTCGGSSPSLRVPFSCSSSVGNQQVGKQRLSIGKNCDRFGIVEHEFLHALGFDHEQSRADRDDYVNIMWDRIQPGNVLIQITIPIESSFAHLDPQKVVEGSF